MSYIILKLNSNCNVIHSWMCLRRLNIHCTIDLKNIKKGELLLKVAEIKRILNLQRTVHAPVGGRERLVHVTRVFALAVEAGDVGGGGRRALAVDDDQVNTELLGEVGGEGASALLATVQALAGMLLGGQHVLPEILLHKVGRVIADLMYEMSKCKYCVTRMT